VTEGATGSTFVARVAVYDGDSGSSGQVTCSVSGSSDRMFRLVHLSTGEYRLVTAADAVFDRETVADYRVTISCRDRGNPPLSSNSTIDVLVDDVNDNDPRMLQDRYVIEVAEDNLLLEEIGQVGAVDADEGENSVVAFRLEPAGEIDDRDVIDAIVVDPTSGRLTASIVFDYERRRKYSYRVIVVDGGRPSRSGTAQLDVIVIDQNDKRPYFRSADYQFSVAENLPIGTVVGRVEALDGDVTADFRSVEYRLEEPSSLISVDASTGELRTLVPLDHEETSKLQLRIFASDLLPDAEDYSPSFCDVTIDVIDENDNDPVIVLPAEANETIFVDETGNSYGVDERGGSKVIKIDALDADEGPEANLTYFIADGSPLGFVIDSQSGWIAVTSSVARLRRTREGGAEETAAKTIELTVGVTDNGNPSRTTFGRLTLHVAGLTESGGGGALPPSVGVRSAALTWTHRLVLVVGSAVGVAVMVAAIFLVVVSTCCYITTV